MNIRNFVSDNEGDILVFSAITLIILFAIILCVAVIHQCHSFYKKVKKEHPILVCKSNYKYYVLVNYKVFVSDDGSVYDSKLNKVFDLGDCKIVNQIDFKLK